MAAKTYSQQLVESINGILSLEVEKLTVVKSTCHKDL